MWRVYKQHLKGLPQAEHLESIKVPYQYKINIPWNEKEEALNTSV